MPKYPGNACVPFLGFKLSRELKSMLNYTHMLKFSAELKPKLVFPTSLVIGMNFPCNCD